VLFSAEGEVVIRGGRWKKPEKINDGPAHIIAAAAAASPYLWAL